MSMHEAIRDLVLKIKELEAELQSLSKDIKDLKWDLDSERRRVRYLREGVEK